MDKLCIPANPDISGIGVRTAIYAQNLLCFVPLVGHLWDRKISVDEMKGVQDQSIGMLAIAFAILISTVIQATPSVKGQEFTKFHAAVILDLSWMNNTSTWIWFILYAHHRSKTDTEGMDTEPTFRAWYKVLRKPLVELLTRKLLIRGLWDLVTNAPVLTLGSIHLSLMAAVGIWLWRDPSKFGAPLGTCDPSLSIVGYAVSFSSPAPPIFSLMMYSLFLIPGLNLVLPFVFFLTLHISYNVSRKRHRRFYRGLGRILRRRKSPTENELQGEEQHIPLLAPYNPSSSSHRVNIAAQKGNALTPQTAFLVVGLAFLFVVNILFLNDIELTLSRNKHLQSGDEELWGFGQVLALLLLVVPLRDVWNAFEDIQGKLRSAQKQFEELFKRETEAVNTIDILRNLVKQQQANPRAKIAINGCETFLELAAYSGKQELVQFLLDLNVYGNIPDKRHGTVLHAASAIGNQLLVYRLINKGMDVNIVAGYYGTALQAASAYGNVEVVYALLAGNADPNVQGHYGTALCAASANGEVDSIKLLLEAGADVNLQGDKFGTALHVASLSGNMIIVQLLLKYKADGNLNWENFGTALNVAEAIGHRDVLGLLHQKEFTRASGAVPPVHAHH